MNALKARRLAEMAVVCAGISAMAGCLGHAGAQPLAEERRTGPQNLKEDLGDVSYGGKEMGRLLERLSSVRKSLDGLNTLLADYRKLKAAYLEERQRDCGGGLAAAYYDELAPWNGKLARDADSVRGELGLLAHDVAVQKPKADNMPAKRTIAVLESEVNRALDEMAIILAEPIVPEPACRPGTIATALFDGGPQESAGQGAIDSQGNAAARKSERASGTEAGVKPGNPENPAANAVPVKEEDPFEERK